MLRCSKVLVVGSGGREHALALRLLASDSVEHVIVCPGNAGTAQTPPGFSGKKLESCGDAPLDAARRYGVDLVVVGPEGPLVAGLADELRAAGFACFGPSRAAARLEASKAFMKEFCARQGIRVARDVIVRDLAELDRALATFDRPPVVKADGLCAGKGVTVAESFEEARLSASEMLSGRAFGAAGSVVVLEERILGAEASIHAICDGNSAFLLPAAQDHKRIFDGDQGPNTGGMGTYAPAPLITPALLSRIDREIMQKAVTGMRAEGCPFIGALFAGVMIDPSGEPVLLEFNVRFGDPETQVLTAVVDGDFGLALASAAHGAFAAGDLRVSADHALCVVLAAPGYPETPETGDPISGLDQAAAVPGARVVHAGTRLEDGRVVTSGGRVLGVIGRAENLVAARERAYQAALCIEFRGRQLRRDIGYRALASAAPSAHIPP